jgi:hypothetical protein
MAYLTPFNSVYSPERASHSIREHRSFSAMNPESVHLSWLDIADIELTSDEPLWAQHREFVSEDLCADLSSEMREFSEFFSAEPMGYFLNELEASGVAIKEGTTLFDEVEDVDRLVSALKHLIESPEAKRHLHRSDKIDHDLKERFRQSVHGPKHDALFALAEEYEGVWLGSGKNGYGLRVAHQKSSGGVSLCTVRENEITIGQKRPASSNTPHS